MSALSKPELLETYFRDRLETDEHRGGYPFITISRQPGAGGMSLGRSLVEAISGKSYADRYRNWDVFDRRICKIVGADLELMTGMGRLLREEYPSHVEEFVASFSSKHADDYKVYRETFRVIRTLASIGKVVLIGRGSCCATRDLPSGIHVRLVADRPERIKNMMQQFDVEEAEAERMMEVQSRDRARLISDFFGRDINDPKLYTHVFDTSVVPLEEIANKIVADL